MGFDANTFKLRKFGTVISLENIREKIKYEDIFKK